MRSIRVSSRAWVPSFLLLAAATFLPAGYATAQTYYPGSIALRWDNCYSDGGITARSFACNTNSGLETLVLSAWPPVDMPQLNGATTIMTLWSIDATLPSWWQSYSGGCRGTTGMSAQFTPPLTSINCIDPWFGQAAGGIDVSAGYYGPQSARIRTVCAIPGSISITGGQETFIARVVIFHSKAVGAGSCAGCLDGACIGLNSIQLYQPLGVGDYIMNRPLDGTTSDFVGWQMNASMGSYYYSFHGSALQKDFTSCSAATATRRPTWGAIKSLYR